MAGRDLATADAEADSGTGAGTLTTSHGGAADEGAVSAALAVRAGERYRMGEEIARGGGGRVIEAQDLALDRTVAIKVPLGASGAARLRDEAEALARLAHPSIVPVYDVGVGEDGLPFFAMKRVGGRSLREALKDARSLEQRLALVPVVIAVAEAIAFAHARGVLHRDLKPGNVLVGEFGETLVIDWGLAVGMEQQVEGVVEGTPAYMPPEQARGEAVDERADVYAIGAILYQVLTGEAPYARVAGGALAAVRAVAPERVEVSQPRAPRDLVAIVEKAMAREVGARYGSARAVADDLERFQTGRLVSARRYSLVARARRWMGRHRAVVAVGAAAMAASGVAVMLAMGSARVEAGPACPGDPRVGLEGVWDDARRARLAQGLTHPSGSGEVAVRAIDAYAEAWARMAGESCVATRVRKQQSEAMFDARAVCLAQRRDELGEMLEVIEGKMGELALRAPEMVGSLQPVEDCGDLEVLRGLEPPPASAEARAGIEGARRLIARAKARHAAGDYQEATAIAEEAVAAARATGYRPVMAEALYRRGRSASQVGDYAGAETALLEAVLLGESARHDQLVAHVWETLVYVVAGSEKGWERLDHWVPRARGALARLGDPPGRVAKLEAVLGLIEVRRGREQEGIAHWRKALALWDGAGGAPDSTYYAHVVNSLGAAAHMAGDYEEARRMYEQALAMVRGQLGAKHPDQIGALRNLSELDLERGDVEGAARRCAEIRALVAEAPPEPRNVASAELWCVKVDVERDPGSAAAGLERLEGLRGKMVGHHEGPWRARRGDLLQVMGKWQEALGEHRAALEVARKKSGESARYRVIDSLGEIAEDLEALGRRAEAIAAAREAVEVAHAEGAEVSAAARHEALLRLARLVASQEAATLLGRAESLETQNAGKIPAPMVEARKQMSAGSGRGMEK